MKGVSATTRRRATDEFGQDFQNRRDRSGPGTDGGNQLEADLPRLMSMEDSMRSTTSVLIEALFWWKEMVDGTKVIVPGTALSSM